MSVAAAALPFWRLATTATVVGGLLVVYWIRHRAILIHHRISVLQLLGVIQPWDTVIVLGIPTSLSILLVLHLMRAKTLVMLPCVAFLSTSSLTCLGTPWMSALLCSIGVGFSCLHVYGMARGYNSNFCGCNDSHSSRQSGLHLMYGGDDDHVIIALRRRRSMIWYSVIATICFLVGWMHGTWMSYGSLVGDGFVWEADVPLLGGIDGEMLKQPVRITSMLAVGLGALLFVLLPPLLSVDVGSQRTNKLAGKLFVLHSAGTVVLECILIPHVHGTVSRGGLALSSLHVVLTSVCGICIAWCLSRDIKGRKWFRRLPVQDAWMAACIHASNLAALLPAKDGSTKSGEVSVALGTFCILATLTAPFAWYDPPEKDQDQNQNQTKNSKIHKQRYGVMMSGNENRNDGSGQQQQKVYLRSWKLAVVHILVGAAGVLVYRSIFILKVFPFVDGLSGGILSTLVDMGKDDSGRREWSKTPAAAGLQMLLLGTWMCAVMTRHFPKDVASKRVGVGLALFGILLCLFNPPLDLLSVWLSILTDLGLLNHVQMYTNPWTGHAFYADQVGMSSTTKSTKDYNIQGLWKPWALFSIVLILINKMSDWMDVLWKRRAKRKSSSGRLLTKDVINAHSVVTNLLLGVVSTCWLLSASLDSVTPASYTAVHTNGFTFYMLEFVATTLLVSLFFTTFERILVLPPSTVISSRALPMYAVILSLLMFHIGLVEINALLNPDLYVRGNVHPLSTTLLRVVKKTRGLQRIVLKDGLHEIERLMTIHGTLHLVLAIVVRFKYNRNSPFLKKTGTRSSGVESVSERMRSLGLGTAVQGGDRAATVGGGGVSGIAGRRAEGAGGGGGRRRGQTTMGRRNSSQHSSITDVLDGQRVLQVLGTTSTIISTLTVGVVCLTRSVGKYESIVLSSLVLILVPRSSSNIGQAMSTFTTIVVYVSCALDVEVISFDVIGRIFSKGVVSPAGGTEYSWWWIPTLNALTLLGTIPLQRTIVRVLWSGGVGGRAGLSGLILPMPLAIVCMFFTESISVWYAFVLSSALWLCLVWRKWK